MRRLLSGDRNRPNGRRGASADPRGVDERVDLAPLHLLSGAVTHCIVLTAPFPPPTGCRGSPPRGSPGARAARERPCAVPPRSPPRRLRTGTCGRCCRPKMAFIVARMSVVQDRPPGVASCEVDRPFPIPRSFGGRPALLRFLDLRCHLRTRFLRRIEVVRFQPLLGQHDRGFESGGFGGILSVGDGSAAHVLARV